MNAGKSTGMMVGPLVKDPIFSETKNGNTVITIVIRIDNGYTAKDGNKVERIEEVPVKFIGNTATAANNLNLEAGDLVICQFHTGGREYNDRYYSELVADGIELVSRSTEGPSLEDVVAAASGVPVEKDDSDLPF